MTPLFITDLSYGIFENSHQQAVPASTPGPKSLIIGLFFRFKDYNIEHNSDK